MSITSCPSETTLTLIAGRWRLMIIYWLSTGPRRFNQLQRDLGPITHRTLAQQLKAMEADGLVTRHDFKQIPPKVEYSLTALGQSLQPVLQAMEDWSLAHGTKTRPKNK